MNVSMPDEAKQTLRGLLEGNDRFRDDRMRYRRDVEAAKRTAPSQSPKAAVFTCVDSRVMVESVFDCDFGELAVVRTAGHVPDRAAVGSLEFIATELKVDVVVVLGHQRCGAIAAALETVKESDDSTGTGFLIEQLWDPAAQALKECPDDAAPYAETLHVRKTVASLNERDKFHNVPVIGATYELDTGAVKFLDV
ncbi:carbonic anhydrase [Haloglycomyces albus]|uniref:carbonic anhydrase n=1 Tax=Haloglycomyces albus TaxID=526067 RepID=UPI00046CF4DB|nr:carbonic anhydrase [Haloglycomyces albus]